MSFPIMTELGRSMTQRLKYVYTVLLFWMVNIHKLWIVNIHKVSILYSSCDHTSPPLIWELSGFEKWYLHSFWHNKTEK